MFYVILATDKCRKQGSELHNDGLSGAFTIKTEKKIKLTPRLLCSNVQGKLQGI